MRRRNALYWAISILIAAIYVAYYATQITHYNAIPFFDQTNYISRIYYILDAWHASHGFLKFDPHLILGGSFSSRPPLMMIPAALMWGDHAQPQSVAILWLIIRTCVLIFSLFVISRIADTARFVPAALLTILGSTFLLEIHPHLYLMDHTFTFFALASFALCLLDLKLQTWRTAALNAIAAVALLLIKPAALSFLFPEFCVIAVTWILNFFAP